jgi:hypothetical protein
MHRVRLPRVVRTRQVLVVSPVISHDLVLVVVPEVVVDLHADGGIETILESVTDDSEVRQSHPAGLDRARARHSVALAFLTHLRLHVLLWREEGRE